MPHWFFDSGYLSAVIFLVAVLYRFVRKVDRRIDADETVKRDYPPHRHINGKIIYPKEYQPARTESLGGSGAD